MADLEVLMGARFRRITMFLVLANHAAVLGFLCIVLFSTAAGATPIDDKYAALGSAGGFLGTPTIAESTAPDGVGKYRHYQHGSISDQAYDRPGHERLEESSPFVAAARTAMNELLRLGDELAAKNIGIDFFSLWRGGLGGGSRP